MTRGRRLKSPALGRWRRISLVYWLLLRARLRHGDPRQVYRLAARGCQAEPVLPPLTRSQRRWIAQGVRSTQRAARWPFAWARCLDRSMALLWWLETKGIRAHLRLGARKDGPKLVAHAWVEYQGQVLNDRQSVSEQFTPLLFPHDLTEGTPAVWSDAAAPTGQQGAPDGANGAGPALGPEPRA